MSELNDKLLEIKRQKDTYILPANLKKDVTAFGVTGTYEGSGGSGDVKLFDTVEHMQQDETAQEGDLAVVYREEIQPVTEESEFSSCIFPNTVVLDEAFTGSISGGFRNIGGGFFDGMVEMSSSRFRFIGDGDSDEVMVQYTSSDGITYTRTDGGEELQEFGTTIKWESWDSPFDNVIGNFMKMGWNYFEGLYEYKSNEYVMTKNQLNATPDYVYEKTFYGKNGVETGTLGIPDNSFADINAEVYNKIQNQYEIMEPRVLTDDDKTIDKNIYFIPVKSDGTPLLDTSNVTNMASMFSNCSNLTSISLLDTRNVTDMSGMFNSCSNLTSIPLLDTSNVTDMRSMFYRCSSLTTIPLLDTSNVTNMASMFSNCSNLTSIPLLDTSNVTNMASMFSNCSNLTSISLLDTRNVTDMSGMFNSCSNLTSIPLLDTSSITNFEYMFYNCPSLNNTSLNNILAMCANAAKITSNKTLYHIGLTEEQANICQSLSNYQAFVNAGWTTGY